MPATWSLALCDPVTFTSDLILNGQPGLMITMPEASLVTVVSTVLVLSRGHTHTHRQTWINTLLLRLSLAWAITYRDNNVCKTRNVNTKQHFSSSDRCIVHWSNELVQQVERVLPRPHVPIAVSGVLSSYLLTSDPGVCHSNINHSSVTSQY